MSSSAGARRTCASLFSVQEGQARVDAIVLYDGYAPPWHHELGELEPDSDLGVALWVAGGGRDIEQGDVFSGDGEMGFTVDERAANMAWSDLLPPLRREQVSAVLVELPGGEGVVRRGDGLVVVTEDVRVDRGLPLPADDIYRPAKTWLPDDRSLVAGMLPPGSVSAEVVDDRGERIAAEIAGGAYAAVLEQPNDGHEPVVCCRDGTGSPVRRPLPADYPSTPGRGCRCPVPGVWSDRLRGVRSDRGLARRYTWARRHSDPESDCHLPTVWARRA